MRNLAIVPARGGSKRLPGKNIQPLAGKPLIYYTLEAALQSKCFDEVIFTSDSDEYLDVAGRINGITLEKRQQAFAGDTVKVIDTVCEIADRDYVRDNFETITLLLPTCPFRRASDIRNGFGLLDKSVDAIVSMTEFEFPIGMSMNLDEETLDVSYVFDPSPLVTGNTRSQDHKPVYRPNGGFYIAWGDSLRREGNYFRGSVRGCVMPRTYSVDIDDKIDFLFAELLLKENVVAL